MRFPYHDASSDQFESLVIEICRYLLGDGIQGFSSGPDGGRDGRFEGTAALVPSTASPHSGRFVIQAKHSENPVAKFSDTDFSGAAASAELTKEMPRIKALVDADECDHYYLFSNRRLGGNANSAIRNRIKTESGAPSVELYGIEQIDDIVKRYPKTMALAGLSELRLPMHVTPDDLASIIVALAEQKEGFKASVDDTLIARTPFDRKNELNNFGDDLAAALKRTYLRDFPIVDQFLAHPDNVELKERYLEAVAEFNDQIFEHVDGGASLGTVLLNLQRNLWHRDGDLARHKRLTKLVLYYMYWICDLGKNEANAQANETH